MAAIILLCNEKDEPNVREWIDEVIEDLQGEGSVIWTWSCGKVRKIQVGDTIFFQRTGDPPRGYFAHAVTVPLEPEGRLNVKGEYKDLSDAYENRFYGNSFRVGFQINSIVRFDLPLEIRQLEKMPKFQGCNFTRFGGGTAFDDRYTLFLEEEWDKHCDKLSKTGHAFWWDEGVNQVDQTNDEREEKITDSDDYSRESHPDEESLLEEKCKGLADKDRQSVTKARVGQGVFRKAVIDYWSTCAVTGCSNQNLLIASHIKPWADCDPQEAVDQYNGLLLVPSLDIAFDRGYISFKDDGEIILSPSLDNSDAQALGITSSLRLKQIDDRHRHYLKYHRENLLRTEK